MNIYQRMSAVTADLQTVAKNLTIETGGGKGYKAVSERDIIDAVKPLEIKHGIYSYPVSRVTTDAQMFETESQKYGKRTTFYTRVETVYRFVNVDKPEEYVEMTSYGVGLDSGDKGDGKAMTYSDKYALMKAYKISTGDDPDQEASKDLVYKKAGTSGPTLASKADKEKLIGICKMLELNVNKILTKTGWEEGDKLTQEQADRAFVILQEISEGRESEGN